MLKEKVKTKFFFWGGGVEGLYFILGAISFGTDKHPITLL